MKKRLRVYWIRFKAFLGFAITLAERGKLAFWITRNIKLVDEDDDDYDWKTVGEIAWPENEMEREWYGDY